MPVTTMIPSSSDVAVPLIQVPPRGKILSMIMDPPLREALEASLVRAGYLLFRARDVWHASVLAGSTLPQLILAEVPAWSSLGSELFDSLRRNKATAEIPVLALLDSTIQDRPGASTFGKSAAAMLKSASLEEIVSRVDNLVVHAATPSFRRIDPAIESVDAVFSEFGMRKSSLSPKRTKKIPEPRESVRSENPMEMQLPHTTPQPKRMKFGFETHSRD
jgi:DNA-binding response OmpR family regulator